MAIENKAVVYIGGRNYTHYTVMPLKWGILLDERLDEMYLSLRRCPVEVFKPLTPVEIRFTNRFYYGSKTIDTQTKVKKYIVANDPQAVESPVGSGRWNHDLYIIELTKYLECIIVDTNTITNDLGRTYTKGAEYVEPTIESYEGEGTGFGEPEKFANDNLPPSTIYRSPTNEGNFVPVPADELWDRKSESPYTWIYNLVGVRDMTGQYLSNTGGSYFLGSALYDIVYDIQYTATAPAPTQGYYKARYYYRIATVSNVYPLKKWTMADIIKRLFDIAEPLRMGEAPRFSLDPQQEAKFDTILAPQMSFTKNTLRECLKECGKVLHGEPRLDVKQAEDGSFAFVVSYDMFGQTERSGISHKAYITKTVSQAIDSYASHLDSNVENLVNQLDKYDGVIVDPYAGGYKTVRTETMYARITDANMLIQTQYPIYTVEKLEFLYGTQALDMTAYLFESSIYNTRLSSYSDQYPNSKAYGLMYTQGQRNITALNFKQEDPISPVFQNYAIVNIIERITNAQLSDIEYPKFSFRVTYTPIYSSRVSQTKVNYQDYPYGAGLIYNQQANIVEARYYGENLKGAIARIGNVEKSITYRLARLSEIPEAGQLYDDDYYISAVSVEFLPTVIKCSIGLSKDFNRLSAYIGVSSVKRFSEVSETQAVERNTLWREYVVIGDEIAQDTDSLIGDGMMLMLADTFVQTRGYKPITNVAAWGGTYNNPEYSGSTVEIPASDVDITYSNETFLITFTLKKQYSGRKHILARMEYNATGYPGEQNNISEYFNGDSVTVDARDNVSVAGELQTITAVVYLNGQSQEVKYPLPIVSLPVVSSAFGNSVAFSWEYEDNYSAGAISQYAEGGSDDTEVKGYFQNNYQYTDYYGKMYYYNFYLQPYGERASDEETIVKIGMRLPGGNTTSASYTAKYITTEGQSPYILRKDNREKLQCNFQIDLVSNRKGMIIGSALASYCPAVRGSDRTLEPQLYVFDEPLNKFIDHVGGEGIDLSGVPHQPISVSTVASGRFSVMSSAFAASGKAWAIVTAQTEESQTVEDEKGEVTQQVTQKGGDVLLAMNTDISAGQAFTPIYFTRKRKIFKEEAWIATK